MAMLHLSADYPEHFQLERRGKAWHWINRPMNIDVHFQFGDDATLPLPPFEFLLIFFFLQNKIVVSSNVLLCLACFCFI